MRINTKIFSLPPYISTSWENVVSLHLKNNDLIISLIDGKTVEISNLTNDTLDLIFSSHAAFLEKRENQNRRLASSPFSESEINIPFGIGISSLEGMSSMLQHNPSQMNAPDMPKEILRKIGEIARIVGPGDTEMMPKAEPHCNCMHCQISRAITETLETPHLEKSAVEEIPVQSELAPQELKYQGWEIIQTNDKMYSVVNKQNRLEQYSVYLGHPVGCTCGQNGCEHILAVLHS